MPDWHLHFNENRFRLLFEMSFKVLKMEALGSRDLGSEKLPGNKSDTEELMKCLNQVRGRTKTV